MSFERSIALCVLRLRSMVACELFSVLQRTLSPYYTQGRPGCFLDCMRKLWISGWDAVRASRFSKPPIFGEHLVSFAPTLHLDSDSTTEVESGLECGVFAPITYARQMGHQSC